MERIMEEYSRVYEQGLIPITKCPRCGFASHMPRVRCPRCGSTELRIEGLGDGVVYSYTIIERGLPNRAIVVLVDVGGVKVKGNYVGNMEKLRIGLRVRSVREKEEIRFTDA
jgi:uncharacterized OB-fold protein